MKTITVFAVTVLFVIGSEAGKVPVKSVAEPEAAPKPAESKPAAPKPAAPKPAAPKPAPPKPASPVEGKNDLAAEKLAKLHSFLKGIPAGIKSILGEKVGHVVEGLSDGATKVVDKSKALVDTGADLAKDKLEAKTKGSR